MASKYLQSTISLWHLVISSIDLNWLENSIFHSRKPCTEQTPSGFQSGTLQSAKRPPKTRPNRFLRPLQDPQSKDWWAALREEVSGQVKKGTFCITKAPFDQPIIPSASGTLQWKKILTDGTIARYKARWVAKGYRQVKGRDYDQRFAPVVRWDTSRILLALSTIRGWRMR